MEEQKVLKIDNNEFSYDEFYALRINADDDSMLEVYERDFRTESFKDTVICRKSIHDLTNKEKHSIYYYCLSLKTEVAITWFYKRFTIDDLPQEHKFMEM